MAKERVRGLIWVMLKPRVPPVHSQPLAPCSALSFSTPVPHQLASSVILSALVPVHLLELGPLSLQHL